MPGDGRNQSMRKSGLSMLMFLAKSQYRNAWQDKLLRLFARAATMRLCALTAATHIIDILGLSYSESLISEYSGIGGRD